MAAPIKGTNPTGTSKGEKLQGKDGDDIITGFGGNDDIDGGRGFDIAVYTGNYSEYTVESLGTGNNKVTVADSVVGRDGTDSLKQVEALQFDDRLVVFGAGGPVSYFVNAEIDESAQKPATETMIAGNGIPATGFGIARAEEAGLELGLQVIYRNGPTVLSSDDYSDGVLEYTVNDGPQSTLNGSTSNAANRAAWNYEWSIAGGLNGETTDLTDFTIKLLIDGDPSAAIDYTELLLVHNPAIATGSSEFFWDAGLPVPFISDDAGIDPTVTQNSQNYAFGAHQALLPPGSTYTQAGGFAGPAQFDIALQAFDSANTLIAENHIQVNVVV
ncbi:MAG TPA: hypothetical protein VED01_09865 [Burkholderiales bacterium]|nr:hypothetical protein [Burkholderiales bacterium]